MISSFLYFRYRFLCLMYIVALPAMVSAQARMSRDTVHSNSIDISQNQGDYRSYTKDTSYSPNKQPFKFNKQTTFKVDVFKVDFTNNLDLNEESLNKNYISHLCDGIHYQTVSAEKGYHANGETFLRFHEFLQQTFPLVHQALKKEIISKYSLLYTWKGQNPRLEPILLIAHMDVVPVDTNSSGQWLQPPFGGTRKDGFIWGRGSMDDKVSVIGILEAVEALIKSGYKPMRDIYIAFGHDEETEGNGAAAISAVLQARGLRFAYVLDEGGGILQGMVPYVESPVAFIGIAEKGYVTLQLTANDAGGHSSLPVDEGVVGILGKAIYRLQENPFPTRLTAPVKQMFRELGKYMLGLNGFVASNPAFFKGIIKKEMSTRPITNSLIQTTLAPTMIEGGMKDNVMPTTARLTINLRIIPGETVQGVIARVKNTIHDKRISVSIVNESWNPSKVTSIKSRSYKVLKHSIEAIFPKMAVAPYLNPGTSDSRHYIKLTDNILRFVPLVMMTGDAERLHGINERISETNYKDCIRFYYRFIINSDLQL
jgi:carboxypeptidase PM20D1